MTDFRDAAVALQPGLVAFRRELHQDPEVGTDLPRTQKRVLDALDGLGLEITKGEALSSVGVVIRGGSGGSGAPAVLLRADMDALPVQERADVPYASTTGTMHACGHDLHTAMLIGAARMLAEVREDLAGDVVLMFQPGEEGFGGAEIMIEEGILDLAGPRVSAAYGMHVFTGFAPGGTAITRRGAMLAASDVFSATMHGRGGHGSAPYRAADPIPALAELVTALQTTVTRSFDPFDPVVVTVGRIAGGTAENVIPDSAELVATVRSFSPENGGRLQELLPRVAEGIAAAHGLRAETDYRVSYPVTLNDADETAFAERVIEGLVGAERRVDMPQPLTGSEDFSFVLQKVPGTFVGLSAAPPGVDLETAPYNHSPLATFDDAVLGDGAAMYAVWAAARLEELAGSSR